MKSKQIVFTKHALHKMAFYRLSEQRVRSVLSAPQRIEEGVAPRTMAMMKPTSVRNIRADTGVLMLQKFNKRRNAIPVRAGIHAPSSSHQEAFVLRWSREIWVMVQDAKAERRIISAWRYPGMTKPRDTVAKEMFREHYDEFRSILE
jgi:hypothetical protein